MLIDETRQHKGQLVGLYSEGELIVSLDSGLAAERGVKAGREYSVGELRGLLAESQLRRAKTKALRLLNYRDYSRRDIAAKLRQDFDEQTVSAVVEYLDETGASDDTRYAENMIRHLTDRKRYGRRRIIQELAAKGIDRETAESLLEKSGPDEPAAIAGLLRGKFRSSLGDSGGIRRTIATLQRYGYEMSDIMSALRDYAESEDKSDDNYSNYE